MNISPPTDLFSLRDSLAVVLPYLSESLASAPAVRQLQALTDTLLPIPRALLECHLGDPSRPVDLSQCVFPAEREWFASFVYGREGWQTLAAFADAWLRPTSLLADHVENVWLEFDTGGSPLPGVFLKLRENEGDQPTADQWQVAESALNILLPDTAHDPLRHYFEAARDLGVVTHIGVMLSRSPDVVRLNVAVESAAAAHDVLDAAGWPGLPPTDELFERVFDYVECPILTFDAGTVAAPRIGLECVPGHRFLVDDGWEQFFDFMLEQKLCSAEQAVALRAWPGCSDPTNSQVWPVHLMLKTLAQPAARLDVLIRQLNHIKLVFQPGTPPVTAKAYLGYNHENINPAELVIHQNKSQP